MITSPKRFALEISLMSQRSWYDRKVECGATVEVVSHIEAIKDLQRQYLDISRSMSVDDPSYEQDRKEACSIKVQIAATQRKIDQLKLIQAGCSLHEHQWHGGILPKLLKKCTKVHAVVRKHQEAHHETTCAIGFDITINKDLQRKLADIYRQLQSKLDDPSYRAGLQTEANNLRKRITAIQARIDQTKLIQAKSLALVTKARAAVEEFDAEIEGTGAEADAEDDPDLEDVDPATWSVDPALVPIDPTPAEAFATRSAATAQASGAATAQASGAATASASGAATSPASGAATAPASGAATAPASGAATAQASGAATAQVSDAATAPASGAAVDPIFARIADLIAGLEAMDAAVNEAVRAVSVVRELAKPAELPAELPAEPAAEPAALAAEHAAEPAAESVTKADRPGKVRHLSRKEQRDLRAGRRS